MNNINNKEKIISLIKRLDLDIEIKNIVINNIDTLNLDELINVIKKYTDWLGDIREKNVILKSDLNKQINKYKNYYEEFYDEDNILSEFDSLIDNI